MITFFTAQASSVRRGDAGQAFVLLLTTLAAILSLVFGTAYIAHLGAEKVASANAIDAIALSAATWEARGLNLIAALNDGIRQCFRLIRWTCVLWAAMAIAACAGLGLSAFLEYSKRAGRLIRSVWRTAQQFAKWAEKVRETIPFLVLAETTALSRELKVTGTLYPFDPRGPHDHERTLELHVVHGPPLTLADALSPIQEVRKKIRKWKSVEKIAGRVLGVIDSVLQSYLGSDMGPIVMLIPEDHLPDRQKVRFSGFRTTSPIPVPFLPVESKIRFFFETSAEPHGGGAADMTWRSRFTEWRRKK